MLSAKVIIEKSRGEVSPMGLDTIEIFSWPKKKINFFFKVSYIFDTTKCATNYRDIFEV